MKNRFEFDPERVSERIRRAAGGKRGSAALSADDAGELFDRYRESEAHFRAGAQECLARNDDLQAAEKTWGAFAQAIKAASAVRGRRLDARFAVIRVAHALAEILRDEDPAAADRIKLGLAAAGLMHQHLCERHLDRDLIRSLSADVDAALDVIETRFWRQAA